MAAKTPETKAKPGNEPRAASKARNPAKAMAKKITASGAKTRKAKTKTVREAPVAANPRQSETEISMTGEASLAARNMVPPPAAAGPEVSPPRPFPAATGPAASAERDIVQAMQHVGSGRLEQAELIFRRVLGQRPADDTALHGLGLVAYLRRHYDEAMDFFTRAIQIESNNPQYHSNLGEALRRAKRPQEALERFERSVVLKPDFLKAHLGVGNTLRDLGRHEEAISRFRLALAIYPNFAEAYHYLGVAFMEQDRLDNAIPLLRKAVALRTGYADAQLSLANALETAGESDEALAIYQEILERDPDNTAVHNNVGNILKNMGRMDDAVSHYRHALELDPDHAPAYYNLSRAQVGASGDDDVKRMETMLEDQGLSDERRVNLHFALGKIFDDLGVHDKAFDHFRKGNGLDRRGEPFIAAQHSAAVDRLMAVFSGEFFANRKGLGSESELPVFILGMPRSGTTLVEQSLASHPKVHGAGELDFIGRIIASMPNALGGFAGYPECATLIEAMTACKLGEDYLSRLRGFGRNAVRITDKMPGNFLNLGFIALMLPNAKIIHCRRQPLDVCLSCYFQHFTNVMPFSRDLADLGHYYRDYHRLMAHWRQVLPVPMLEVPYEEMVADHEGTTRRIVEFAGLEWDDACIEFHTTERPVKTASSWQVRQPIYTTSVERWRKFEAFIGPLKEALGDVLPEDRPPASRA